MCLAEHSLFRPLLKPWPRPDMPGSLRCYTFPLTGDYVEYQAVPSMCELRCQDG